MELCRMEISNYEEFVKHVVAMYPQEACGVVVGTKFIPVENTASNPVDEFRFSIKDSLQYAEASGIIHSHTMRVFKDDPRIPSLADMSSAESSNIPWGIVHCDGENVSDILWFTETYKEPLLGRVYISNVYDCMTLLRDYYRQEYGVKSSSYPRPADWQEWNPLFLQTSIHAAGFRTIDHNEPTRVGDVLLMKLGSNYLNHIAIAISENELLQHLHGRLSGTDSIKKWERFIVTRMRYEGGNE
jgi:proteasome lid subunit RPN8/RPN11